MAAPKRHLAITPKRVACGAQNPSRTTHLAAEVTCEGCSRTLHMADAEAQQRHIINPVQSLNQKGNNNDDSNAGD